MREANVTVEWVVEALDAGHNYRAASLDAPAAARMKTHSATRWELRTRGLEVAGPASDSAHAPGLAARTRVP
jgi:hypothetical protein